MFRLNFFSFSLIIFAILANYVQCDKTKCNSTTDKEMDETVSLIMTFGTSRKFPLDKDEFKEYCKDQTKYVNKLENYRNVCLKDQAKSVVSVIIYSIKQVISTYCKRLNSKRTAELMDSATCANVATNDYNKCSIEYVQRLVYSKSLKTSKDRLIQACCGYFTIPTCIQTQANKYPDVCTQERIDANIAYIKNFFDNAINAACGEYNGDSDKCDRVTIPPPKKSKKPLPKSFFNPLVKLLSSI